MRKFISGILVLCMLILPITSFAVEKEGFKKEFVQLDLVNIEKQSSNIGVNVTSSGFDTAIEIAEGESYYDNIDPSGNTKYYKVEFPKSGAVEFWLNWIPEGVDYDLSIYDENREHIAYSSRNDNNTELIIMNVEPRQWYYLVVDAFNGYSNDTYYVEAQYCSDTTLEPNETYKDAFRIGTIDIVHDTISSSSDEDWYRISNIGYNFSRTLRLKNIPEGTDYDLEVYDENRRLIDFSANSKNKSEKIDFEYRSREVYYIRVYSYSGSDRREPYRLYFD